jgi:glucose-1-phosphate cytidylyltransferase
MIAVILAGGYGTRFSEETNVKPKPMIEIGEKPILWHIMKGYAYFGITDFIICCGYKGYMIKEYFSNYFLHNADVTFDLKNNRSEIHSKSSESWKVTLVDTGEKTMTGGRLKRVRNYLNDEDFCFTYGDGVSDINILELIKFHKIKKTLVTLTGVRPPGRFGQLSIDGERVTNFREKPLGDEGWINGGFFVINPSAIDLIQDDQTVWEGFPLEQLSHKGELSVYKHNGFWQSMDKKYDKDYLEKLWKSGTPPWKQWN